MLTNIFITDIDARPRPDRGLLVSFRGKGYSSAGGSFGFLLDLSGLVEFGSRVVSRQVVAERLDFQELALMKADMELTGQLFIPFSVEALEFIEAQRRGADVHFVLKLRLRWQETRVDKPGHGDATYDAGKVFWTVHPCNWQNIAQSEWIALLEKMGWEEWRLFELPVQPLIQDDNLAQAIKYLEEAQGQLRRGDYDGCLADCRSAFESAAKYHAPGDTKTGFDRLLERAFPLPPDRLKKELLPQLLKALNDYIHPLGRHAQAPHLPVTRAEAEFVLTTSVSLMSLLSRSIADAEARVPR